MTRHLSGDTLVEMAEAGTSDPHIAGCERCRRALEDARQTLALARGEDVPEPSPLFWDHFSARVREAIDREPDASRPRPAILSWPRARLAVAIASLVVVVGVVAGWHAWHAGERAREQAPASAAAGPRAAGATASLEPHPTGDLLAPAADPSWTVIAQVTAHVRVADAADAGLVLPSNASDRAIAQLTPAEQQELIRLLQGDPDSQ